jgi:hypothetical protein
MITRYLGKEKEKIFQNKIFFKKKKIDKKKKYGAVGST